MVFYFIFEALYCRFFFFFFILTKHLLRYIWRLRPFLLSSSFSPLLLFNNSFFSFCPHRYPLNGINPCCFFVPPTISPFYSHSILFSSFSSSSYRFRYGCNDPRRLSPSFEILRCVLAVLPFFPSLSLFLLLVYLIRSYPITPPREIDIAVQTWTREPMNF